MHVEMDFDQMFLFRPLPEMSQYKTPIKNLYSNRRVNSSRRRSFCRFGYNTAQVVLKDVKGFCDGFVLVLVGFPNVSPY
jgi:hypothetical protein